MFRLVLPSSVHLVFEIAAFFFGFQYYLFLKKRSGDVIPEMNRLWIIVGATAGAFVGSHLVGAFENSQLLDWHS
ncbi:MAG: hypothetical protein M3R17_10820 [Bacteroidota bacterium]|nr:hypothetical protein [Bacteroidota bacterium]